MMKENNKMAIWTVVGVIVLAALGYWIYLTQKSPEEDVALFVSNFEECEAAGYSIMESYPRQCRTPGGTSYTEDISEGEVLNAEDSANVDAELDLDNLSK